MKYRLIAILSFIGTFILAQASELRAEVVLAPMTDRVVVEIAQPPEKVWAFIKRMYRDGDRYRQLGLEVTPISNDPSAYLGGYRGAAKSASTDGVPDMTVYLSAVDDDSMFLAMYMEGGTPRGLYITHQVSPSGTGSRYQGTLQGFVPVELPEGETPTFEAVNQWMTRRVAEHHAGLEAMMEAIFAKEFVSKD